MYTHMHMCATIQANIVHRRSLAIRVGGAWLLYVPLCFLVDTGEGGVDSTRVRVCVCARACACACACVVCRVRTCARVGVSLSWFLVRLLESAILELQTL